MQFKALWKDTFREIPKSIMRFLAILVIIFLGVGFFVGISATSPDMILTADDYFTNYNLMDFRVQSTYGLTDEDLETLGEMDGYAVESHYAYDFYVADHDQTIRLISYDAENGQDINQYHLAEGRLPENPGEIALDRNEGFLDGLAIGDTMTLETGEENGSPEENLNQQTFEIVGFVDSPLYITYGSRGFTTIGSGSLNGFGVILEDDYDTDIYTEATLMVEGSQQYQSFSEEYQQYIDGYEEELDGTLANLEEQRGKTIQEEAQAEIDDGWAELEAGEQELAEAETELADARTDLDNAWQEYEDGRVTFEDEMAAAEAEINRNEEQLDQTIADLETQKQEFMNQRAELETQQENLNAAEAELASGQEQLQAGLDQINAGIAELQAAGPEIEAGLAEINTQEENLQNARAGLVAARDGLDELDAAVEGLQAQRTELENALNNPEVNEEEVLAQITANEAQQAAILSEREAIEQQLGIPGVNNEQIDTQIAEIDNGLAALESNRQELNATLEQEEALISQRNELESQLEALNTQEEELVSGREQLTAGISQIDDGLAQLDDGIAQANAGYGEIEEARATLETEAANAEAELDDAEAQLNEAEAEYEEGLATFEEERETALADLEEGREELEQAEQDLADLPMPEYLSSRRSDNSSYIEYKDNTDRLSIIAKVFPVFFFLIAIFISFTTMTRMVDEEREYIGIMKALGYANRQILTKFITYSVLATAAGTLLGLVVGYTLIPRLIFWAYGSMYHLPEVHIQQYTLYTVIATIAAFGSTVGASMLAVRNSLQSNAATLLQPKAPKSGTHIWLEKIPFIWNRLSFNYKITFRNVFRYKSRMFMTIFGIAGSTGLILTGFGISDSISTIPETQYTELNHFQAYVALDTAADENELNQYVETVQADERIDNSLLTLQESVTVDKEGVNAQEATIFVPEDPERLADYVTLRHYETGEPYTFDDSGAYITQKLAQLFDVTVGDDMPVISADDEEWTVEVAGIVENYVGHMIYMTPAYFQEISGHTEMEPSLQLVKFDTDEVNQEQLGSDLISEDAVAGITYVTDVYDGFSDTLNSLDMITQILVISAAALAFIVLYNLTNINVSERERELSTIKVLGFHDIEVTMYIYRENIILTLIGIFFGCIFGTVLQRFIMTTMEVDQLVFGKVIHPSSYVYSILLTLLFTIIVMVVIHYQLKRIDMVEALKAND